MGSKFKYTIGADPEMMVRSLATGLLVPICDKVGGTKDQPLPFTNNKGQALEGFKYQEDNVAFEVNIPPCATSRDFTYCIQRVLDLSNNLLAEKGLKLEYNRSAHRFAATDLLSPKAQTIGCDPDMCAYGGKDDAPIAREPFDIKDLGTWRFAGGHIHFGYDMELDVPPHVVVRLIDACVYLPIISKDKQKARRTKYGLAGLYRVKPYGVEYRTMSNFWLRDVSVVSQRCFNLMKDLHNHIELLHDFYRELPCDEVQACINNGGAGSKTLWRKLCKLPNFNDLFISSNGPADEADSPQYAVAN